MMTTNNGAEPKRTESQPTPAQKFDGADGKAAPGAESRRGGETLPQLTEQYRGPKHGLPQEFGCYRVLKQLGEGGMGAVFLVENTKLGREEALKVPHFDAAGDPEVHERFLREAKSAAGLDHPNLCSVYDVGVWEGVYYLTMRYLKGKPLSDGSGTAQPPRKAVEITTKLAQALATAHAKGVIHRDLKPNNIMMCPGVGPVVMDFGLAKQTRENQKLTQSGTTLGTPVYMPPEQVRGELDRMGPASDVYSLGVILFEMLTGRLPFKAATAAEVYGKILHTEAPAPSSLRPGLNPALDAICAKAMAKEPKDRYPSMKAFAAALIEFLKATRDETDADVPKLTKARPGEIFQAPTVAPGAAPAAWWQEAPAAPTPSQSKAPSSIRKPAATQRGRARTTVVAPKIEEEREGWSIGGVLGMLLLVLLMLGALGGVGYLVYAVSQNKNAPSNVAVAQVKPIPPSGEAKSGDEQEKAKPTTETGQAASQKVAPQSPDATEQDSSKNATKKNDPLVVPVKGGKEEVDSSRKTQQEADSQKTDSSKTKKTDPTKQDDSDPSILLNEDFKEVDVGGRPKGWDGDNFAVQKENDRPCLEVTSPKDLHYVTLPKLAIKGDFVMDCEFLLGYPHEFHLELGSRSSTPLTILVDGGGGVRIDQAEPKPTEGFKYYTTIRFRLKRKGDVYNVSINDTVTAGLTLPGKGTFDEVRIGLPGGTGDSNALQKLFARIYSVKITSQEKPVAGKEKSDATPPPPPQGIRENFSKATAGSLPDGWTASNAANLNVQKSGDNADLELTTLARGGDFVILPKIDLQGNFYADVAAVLTERDTSVAVLFKGTRTKPLIVEMSYGGTLVVPGFPKVEGNKAWLEGKPNVLRVERSGSGKGYVIKLNDSIMGNVPLAAASGPFTEVDLAVTVKDAKKKSPHVTSVQVVPLEEAP